mmetsp:Transcript_76948/g.174007  ORF Transcript_76948/g.174007 Transcript_76948/m.174007 type:complete len:196 (+) Transcript_76948:165-752(+)
MEKPLPGPVFVENPDGSLAQGLPPGYKEQTPPSTPRQTVVFDPTFTTLNSDIVRVLARHETVFLCLLFIQMLVESAFETLHIAYREDAVFELHLIYPSVSRPVLRVFYWTAFVGESTFSCALFALGIIAAFRSKPRLYQRFSTVALVGTLGQLPLAYLNRFNLLIFFLRFIAYAYSRFHWNLLHAISLLRDDLIL